MTKQKARRKAEENGHVLGRFKTNRYSWDHPLKGQVMGYTAHCERCGDACFADDKDSPALKNKCTGKA